MRTVSLSFARLPVIAVSVALVGSLLTFTPSTAGAAETQVASQGARPADRPLPKTALPRHGAAKASEVPVVPPGTDAKGEPTEPEEMSSGDSRAARSADAQASGAAESTDTRAASDAEAGPPAEPDVPGAASKLLLRPGYLLGDTSLVAYFEADVAEGDPESWARWWATVRDVESGAEQRSVELDREDLTRCGVPRTYCRSFGEADGWVLDPAREYEVVITVVGPEGAELDSKPSPQAKPRRTIVPPSMPAAQAAGCSCPNVLGRTIEGQELRGAMVNTATGAFLRTERDLGMASFGIPFEAVRFYSSATPSPGMFGSGWSWTYDARILAASEGDGEGAVRVRAEDGAEAVYSRREDGSLAPPAGVRSTLRERDGGGWVLIPPDQRRLTFDAEGRLLSVKDARGHGVTLAYGSDGLLSSLTDAAGRRVSVEQRSDVRAIRKINLPDGRSVQYDYEAGRLAKVQDARGNTWQYRYDEAGRMTQVINPRGRADLVNTYGADGRVAAQADALGATTTFEWDDETQQATTTDADGVGVVDGYRDNVLLWSKNANGDSRVHRYDERLNPALEVDGKGNQRVTEHDEAGNPVAETAPEPFSFTERNAFDDRNNLTRRVDGRGHTWSYTYSDQNEMTSQQQPGQEEGYTYTYDDRGLMLTREDPRGKVTRYEYNAAGNRTAEITATGRRTEFGYDSTGRMTSITDPRGTEPGADRAKFTTRLVHDQQDRVIERWEPGKQGPSRFRYSELGHLVVTTDPMSNSTNYDYDDAGRVVTVKSPKGDVTKYEYTDAGRRKAVLDGEGNRTSWTYDPQGRVRTETSPRGNAVPEDVDADEHRAAHTTTFSYDYNGNLVRAERPRPGGGTFAVDSSFDELDRPVGQVDELGKVTKVGYDETDNVTSMTDEEGNSLGLSYDAAGRRTGGDPIKGGAAEIDYDDAGNVVRQVSPNGGVVTYTYDDDGRPLTVTEPRGNVSGADPADFTTKMAYDAAGNLESVTDPLGNVTRYAYDALDRQTAVTDANGHTTRFTYDDADRVSSVRGPDAESEQQSLRFTYDSNGQVIKQTDPLGRNSSMEYDRAGRLIASTDPIGRRKEFVYDADSNLIEQVTARVVEGDPRVDPNREHRTIFFSYDTAGRMTRKQLGTDGPVYTYGYDAKNRLVEQADPAGLTKHEYNETGLLEKVIRGDQVFEYAYDENDNLTDRAYPDGTKIKATYDVGDRLETLTATRGEATARYGFDYDVADNLDTITYPEASGIVEDRDYDRAGRLSSITSAKGGQVLAGYDLALDKVGNPLRVTKTTGGPNRPTVEEVTSYAYDAANRLRSACYGASECTSEHTGERINYGYDLVGNRLTQTARDDAGKVKTTTYRYDGADQLISHTTTGDGLTPITKEYEYDAEGNQTRAGDDRFDYHLDHTLASATVAGRTTSYTYDASGLRLGSVSGEGDQRREQSWTWDVNNPMPMLAVESETVGGQRTEQSYLYDLDGAPLALFEPSGDGSAVHHYLRDWIGGVAGVTDAAGAPQWSYDYDPFGNPRGDNLEAGGQKLDDGAPRNPLQFAGQYQDVGQGDRYHMRARDYDPSTGRFGGVDPIPNSHGPTAISGYAYAANTPTLLTDPTGLSPTYRDNPAFIKAYTPKASPNAPNANDPFASQRYAAEAAVKFAEDAVKQIGDEIVNLILDLVGFNDAKACVTEGDIVACVSTALQAVPWGKLFKAAKVMVKAIGVGKRLVEAYGRLKAARKALESIPKKATDAVDGGKKLADSALAAAKAAAAGTKAAAKKAADTARKAKNAARKAKGEAKKRDPGCTDPGNSFAPGTSVVMADGSTKPIEQIEPGDQVLATDPTTGDTTARPVTAAITGTGDKQLVDLEFVGAGQGGGGPPAGDRVTATDEHPFWTHNRGWVDAEDLRVGDRLRDTDGNTITVTAVRVYEAQATVHNLTVATDHTFYITTPTGTQALTHNTGGRPEDLRKAAGNQVQQACELPLTSRAARRQAMRDQGIPTSQQPTSQMSTPAGHQYTYEIPKRGGGSRLMIATDQTTDRVPGHGPHWEVGEAKVPLRWDPLGRLRVWNRKTKVEYGP